MPAHERGPSTLAVPASGVSCGAVSLMAAGSSCSRRPPPISVDAVAPDEVAPAGSPAVCRVRSGLGSGAHAEQEATAAVLQGDADGVCDTPHDALHVGPLDTDAAVGGSSVDPAMVYVRLSNFKARRKGLNRLVTADKAEVSHIRDIEPLTPFLPHEVGDIAADLMDLPPSRAVTPSSASACPGPTPGGGGASPSAAQQPSCSPPPPPSLLSRQATWAPGREAEAPQRSTDRRLTWDQSEGLAPEDVEDQEVMVEVASVQRHLEAMNAAAADLNATQEALNHAVKQRRTLVQLWAVGSARMGRAVGAHQLAKAAPYYERHRRCSAARKNVEAISMRFLAAQQAGEPEAEVARLAEEHAKQLGEFQAAQRELNRFAVSVSRPSAIAAVAPYFEAEDEHREQLAEVDAAVEVLSRQTSSAKARYHSALKCLEALSEQAHRLRGDAGSRNACSAATELPARFNCSATPESPSAAAAAVSPPLPLGRRKSVTEDDHRPATTTARSLHARGDASACISRRPSIDSSRSQSIESRRPSKLRREGSPVSDGQFPQDVG